MSGFNSGSAVHNLTILKTSHHRLKSNSAMVMMAMTLNIETRTTKLMFMVQTFDLGDIHHGARWGSEDTNVLDSFGEGAPEDTNELSPPKCSCS